MNRRIAVGAILATLALPLRTAADVSYAIFEYRVLSDLSQVRITTGFVHDPALQREMAASRDSFERKGLVFSYVETKRQFVRTERLASHSIETSITLYPPLGTGFGGGMPTAHIVVLVDGRKKIDCPYDGDTKLDDIAVLAVDDMTWVKGSHRFKPFDTAVFGLGNERVIDVAWLDRVAK